MAISDGLWKGCEGEKPTLLIGGSLLRTGFDLTACTWISNSDGVELWLMTGVHSAVQKLLPGKSLDALQSRSGWWIQRDRRWVTPDTSLDPQNRKSLSLKCGRKGRQA